MEDSVEEGPQESVPDGVKKKIEKQLREFFQSKKKYKQMSHIMKTETESTVIKEKELPKEESQSESKSRKEWVWHYDFTHAKRGFAVLIIYDKFEHQSNRLSAVHDLIHMTEIFQALDFNVIVLQNETTAELLRKLKEIKGAFADDHDCSACVVSTHGAEVLEKGAEFREHLLYTYDGAVKTQEIVDAFHCRALDGKPKLFFIQACRGVLPNDPNKQGIDPGSKISVITHTSPHLSHSHHTYPDHSKLYEGTDTDSKRTETGTERTETETERTKTDTESTRDAYTGEDVKKQCDEAVGDLDLLQKRIQQMSASKSQGDDLSENKSDIYAGQDWEDTNKKTSTQSTEREHKTYKDMFDEIKFADEDVQDYTHFHRMHLHRYNEPKVFDFCKVPLYNDCLVMFSAASGTIAWSENNYGGWLLYCLYNVLKSLSKSNFEIDLLEILTATSGKMARDLQSNCPSNPEYDQAKAAASINHKLRKDIYFKPKYHHFQSLGTI